MGRLDDEPLLGAGAGPRRLPRRHRLARQRWLLIEQPGPWGRDALAESRFDAAVAPSSRGAPGRRACGCCWSAVPATGSPTPAAAGPTPTAGPAARGCGGRSASSDADLLDRPLGRLGRRAAGRARPTSSARTAGTTPAARCAAGRWPGRCRRRGRPTSGSAATSAATGSRPTSLVLPHGFYYGQVPGDGARAGRGAQPRARWRCPGCAGRAGVPPPGAGRAALRPRRAGPARRRRPAGRSRCAQLTPPGAEVERWTVTLAGPDGDVVTSRGEPPVGRRPRTSPAGPPTRRTRAPGTWRCAARLTRLSRARGPGRRAAGWRARSR